MALMLAIMPLIFCTMTAIGIHFTLSMVGGARDAVLGGGFIGHGSSSFELFKSAQRLSQADGSLKTEMIAQPPPVIYQLRHIGP